MLGEFYILQGPNNEICDKGKFPKVTQVMLGFSRDGFHWHRPERRPFIAATKKEGDWDRAYIHGTTGVMVVKDDRLYFPYTGYSGIAPSGTRGMYTGASIGLATLRRDGFASMGAGATTGTLTTRPVAFNGAHLFVNVNAPQGSLKAEVLNEAGKVIEPYTVGNCEAIKADSTRTRVQWKAQPIWRACAGRQCACASISPTVSSTRSGQPRTSAVPAEATSALAALDSQEWWIQWATAHRRQNEVSLNLHTLFHRHVSLHQLVHQLVPGLGHLLRRGRPASPHLTLLVHRRVGRMGLTLVMLGMGFTLTVDDFRRLLRAPSSLALGFLTHYTIMPLAGWFVAHALNLEPGFAVGLILVASCPSGTASNVICYLARANVALAVLVTLTSTLLAFVMTPAGARHWRSIRAGGRRQTEPLHHSDRGGPGAGGRILQLAFPQGHRLRLTGGTAGLCARPHVRDGRHRGAERSRSEGQRRQTGPRCRPAARAGLRRRLPCRQDPSPAEEIARTISIEVGMQNGGLAAVLAKQNFPMQPLAAVPAIFSAITQTLLGSLLATWWRMHPVASSNPAATASTPAPQPATPAIPEARPE